MPDCQGIQCAKQEGLEDSIPITFIQLIQYTNLKNMLQNHAESFNFSPRPVSIIQKWRREIHQTSIDRWFSQFKRPFIEIFHCHVWLPEGILYPWQHTTWVASFGHCRPTFWELTHVLPIFFRQGQSWISTKYITSLYKSSNQLLESFWWACCISVKQPCLAKGKALRSWER